MCTQGIVWSRLVLNCNTVIHQKKTQQDKHDYERKNQAVIILGESSQSNIYFNGDLKNINIQKQFLEMNMKFILHTGKITVIMQK